MTPCATLPLSRRSPHLAQTLIADWPILFPATLVTLQITRVAHAVTVAGNVLLAILVTPIVSVAPLNFIHVDNRHVALTRYASIVASFLHTGHECARKREP